MLRLGSLVGRMAGLTLANGPSQPATIAATAAAAAARVTVRMQQPANARGASFFVKISADDLWRGVTSVSNAGRKRGRASGSSRKFAKNLNKGQTIGFGKANMVWPGLNVPVIRGREVVQQQALPPDPERQQRLLAIRDKQHAIFQRAKRGPLERGWSGAKAPGRSLGPPDPIADQKFDDFKSVIIQLRTISIMRGYRGRIRRHKAVVIVGNGAGLCGLGIAKAPEVRVALRKAKNRAIRRQCYFQRYEDHTVLHDFISEVAFTRISVKKKQRGFGLVCHRAIREVCKCVGIKDLYAKVDSRCTRPVPTIRAFLLGLHRQRTHQEIADEKRLHVVEYRPENNYFPRIVASPQHEPVRTEEEVDPYEYLDMDLITSKGRLLVQKPKYEPFYRRLPCWQIHLKKTDNLKNDRIIRQRLILKYGSLKSFLTVREEENKAKALAGGASEN